MGGLGSGHPMWKGKKSTVESCKELDVRGWKRKGYFDEAPTSLTFSWSRGDVKLGTIGVDVVDRNLVRIRYDAWTGDDRANAKSLNYPVFIDWTGCNFGGERPWFVCPGVVNGRVCKRRVAKLYLDGSYFLCRHCHDLTYEVRQTGEAGSRPPEVPEDPQTARRQRGYVASLSVTPEGDAP